MKNLTLYLMTTLIGSGLFFADLCYKEGRKRAFDSIILEECWLNKDSRDIECIEHIAK